ncbi:hypothetical protein CI102_13741 [Trichoderma harzianum]|nr:hypothetical protein CI102_13741 [Trichoderma harzianum]
MGYRASYQELLHRDREKCGQAAAAGAVRAGAHKSLSLQRRVPATCDDSGGWLLMGVPSMGKHKPSCARFLFLMYHLLCRAPLRVNQSINQITAEILAARKSPIHANGGGGANPCLVTAVPCRAHGMTDGPWGHPIAHSRVAPDAFLCFGPRPLARFVVILQGHSLNGNDSTCLTSTGVLCCITGANLLI